MGPRDVKTDYGDLDQQIIKCRQAIDSFIETARTMNKNKEELMASYKGRAANMFSEVIDRITGEHTKENEDIGAQLEANLKTWAEETLVSEQRTGQSIQKL